MAIAYDTSGHTYTASGTTSTVSIAATSANSIAMIGIEYGNGGSHAFSSLQVNGTSTGVTQIGSEVINGGRNIRLYYFLNPSTSSVNYTLTTNNTADDQDIYVAIYSGALQSGQPDSTSSGTNTVTLTLSTTVVNSGCWLFSICTDPAGATLAGTGTTIRSDTGTDESLIGDSNGTVGTGSQSMAWTNALSMSGIIASIQPGGATVNSGFFNFM